MLYTDFRDKHGYALIHPCLSLKSVYKLADIGNMLVTARVVERGDGYVVAGSFGLGQGFESTNVTVDNLEHDALLFV